LTDLKLAVIWLGDTKFIAQEGFLKMTEDHPPIERGELSIHPEHGKWQIDFIGFAADELIDCFRFTFIHIDYRDANNQVCSILLQNVRLKTISIETEDHEPYHYIFTGSYKAEDDDDE